MSESLNQPRFVEGKAVLYALRFKWKDKQYAMLREAYEAGCHLRKTADQHVMITSATGVTTTLANGNTGRGGQALKQYRRDVDKVIKSQQEYDKQHPDAANPVISPEVSGAVHKALVTTGVEPDKLTGKVALGKGVLCKYHEPPRWFETEADLGRHRKTEHYQCKHPVTYKDGTTGVCGEWLRNSKSAGGHTGTAHGNNQPWTHRKDYKGGNGATSVRAREKAERERNTSGGTTPAVSSNGVVTNGSGPTPPPTTGQSFLDVAKLREEARVASKDHGVRVSKPKPGTVDELIQNVRRGKVKGRPVEEVQLPKVAPVLAYDADGKLGAIRAILGEDPQVAELTRERDEWKRRAEDAETKVTMMRAAADQLRAAADL